MTLYSHEGMFWGTGGYNFNLSFGELIQPKAISYLLYSQHLAHPWHVAGAQDIMLNKLILSQITKQIY